MNSNTLFGAIAGLTEANRPIRLRLSQEKGVVDDVLLVKHVRGVERICGGIEYHLLCVSTQANLPTKQFIAMPVELQFVTDSGGMRSVCGIVDGVVAGEADGGLASYQLIVRDALAIMEKSCNTRIFRNKSEVEITEIMLGDWRQKNPILARAFDFELSNLQGNYPQKEFTMQYNESDAAFLRRLWKRRGLSWFFQPGQSSAAGSDQTPGHTLVLFDDSWSLKQNSAGTVRYHRDDGTEQRDCITAWHKLRNLTAGNVTRQSWDYKTARMSSANLLGTNDQGVLGNRFARTLNDTLLEAPHIGDNAADYTSLGTLRIKRHEYRTKCYQAESGVRDLCVGEWVAVTGHAGIDSHPVKEREFVITELWVEAENNLPYTVGERAQRLFALNQWGIGNSNRESALGQANAERGVRYTNQFTCVRRDIPIVPAYDPRIDLPRADAQDVVVVGPENEEVFCDNLGRVKVRFPGVRPEERATPQLASTGVTEHDSAWVRVATSWAGAQWGAISLPRIGTLCRLGFLGGDPDKPIITGAVHGGTTPPPSFSRTSSLPGDRYLSGIVSKEVRGKRANQLRIDDSPGQISVQLGSGHAATQLNLGYLTHPRSNGKATARGDGFELATNESGSLRTAKSLLISAWKRLDASGSQLSSEEHIALMQDCLDLFKSLGQYAAEHQALALDDAPQAALRDDINSAAAGSNVNPQGEGGKPTISVTAPDGLAFSTPKTIVSYGGKNVDTVAQQHVQLTAGQRFNLNAGKGVSVFAHRDGIKQIAHYGKFLMQSQHDEMQIDSATDLKVSAGKHLILMADEITLMSSGGAYFKLKGGMPEIGGTDALHVRTDGHNWDGPASVSAGLPKFSEGDLSRTPRLLSPTDGEPVAGMKLHVERPDANPVTGESAGDGTGGKVTASGLQQLKAFFFTPRA
ncbi:type VI secretion system Vgr family protein [Collimonas sp. OK412]|jgi:type VI secretion system secreted protein VgrG|uniref:type VI secretion system Vgr family protein n=1 Tax=Collimonas sp. (strain OK412) TaxID=1801619 RepID=UPI0008EFE719|nr:type VI secretion system Vgr family protein [Collimonas sp. OK412]SFB92672.1 Rhs element Vgr protein [Collimonas sp. OK412]